MSTRARGAATTSLEETKACTSSASFLMPVNSDEPVGAATCPEQLLLTIGHAGVLSSRAIVAEGLEALLRLLGRRRNAIVNIARGGPVS